MKAQPIEKKSIDSTLNRITIPTILFRDIKLNDDLLISADVDNNLWKWNPPLEKSFVPCTEYFG